MEMVPSVDFLSAMKPQSALRTDVICRRLAEAKWLREVIRARSRRSVYFSSKLFSDPAWDLLLNLYLAELRQVRTAVTDLGNLAGVPPTTSLRWIDALMKEGLVIRQQDPYDARRWFVRLTTRGSEAMRSYCESLPMMVAPFNE
jgi:DNA-binding MarR family transcriptional regulator